MHKLLFIFLVVINNLNLITPSFANESKGPLVLQRINSSTQDATNEPVYIDVYYEVEDETEIDEERLPETFLRLPGYEDVTALRSKPSLISGTLKKGSWLARFSYPKGIRPGIYVASTSEWFDKQGNRSKFISDVTVRIDNLNIDLPSNEVIKPTSIKCGTGQESIDSTSPNSELRGYVLCNYSSNSLKNQIRFTINVKNFPKDATFPEIIKISDEIYSPKYTGTQKASFNFKINPSLNGSYVFNVKIEFLGFTDLTQFLEVTLQTPILKNPVLPKSSSDEYSAIALADIASWNEKISEYARSRNLTICFELPKWNIPSFTEDASKNKEMLRTFQGELYGNIYTNTQQKIDACSTTYDLAYFSNQIKMISSNFKSRLTEKLKFSNTCIDYILSKNALPLAPAFTQDESENRSLLDSYKKSIEIYLDKVVTDSKFKFDPVCLPTENYYKSVNEGLFLEFRTLLLKEFPNACPQLLFPTTDPGYPFVQDAYVKGGPAAAENRVGFYRRVLETRFASISSEIDQKCPKVSANSTPTLSTKPDNVGATITKKITIICVKGKIVKTVIAVKPKCPAGYKKK